MTCLAPCIVVMLGFLLLNKWTMGQPSLDNQCDLQRPACASCGRPVNVTLIARNVMQAPTFELNMSLKLRQGTLLDVLEEAAEVEHGFRFRATYIPSVGYYIDVINVLEGSVENGTFWHLVSQDTGALKCGVSWYIPTDGETILFNFTTFDAARYISSEI